MDKDRVDHYWRGVFKTIESKTGEKPIVIVDSATFKQQGLSQHCELKVRFWSSKFDQVCDSFLTYHSVGHETADIMVENIKKSLV